MSRREPAVRAGQVLGEFDLLAAEPHAHDAHAQTEHALQLLVLARPRPRSSETFSNVRTSVKNATERSMFDTVMPTRVDGSAIAALLASARDRRTDGAHQSDSADDARRATATASSQLSLSSRWSPTRSALAMMVSAGFTAPLDGKKLPSTT